MSRQRQAHHLAQSLQTSKSHSRQVKPLAKASEFRQRSHLLAKQLLATPKLAACCFGQYFLFCDGLDNHMLTQSYSQHTCQNHMACRRIVYYSIKSSFGRCCKDGLRGHCHTSQEGGSWGIVDLFFRHFRPSLIQKKGSLNLYQVSTQTQTEPLQAQIFLIIYLPTLFDRFFQVPLDLVSAADAPAKTYTVLYRILLRIPSTIAASTALRLSS